MDIFQKQWSQVCLDAVAPHLAQRLGDLTPSTAVLVKYTTLLFYITISGTSNQSQLLHCLCFQGGVSLYYTERFGFPENCKVVAFTGDNPGKQSLSVTVSITHTIQCNTIQCNTMQCNTMQYDAMQYNAMQHNTKQRNTMQCNAIQCNTV